MSFDFILPKDNHSFVLLLAHSPKVNLSSVYYWLILPRFTIISISQQAHSPQDNHQLCLTISSFYQGLPLVLSCQVYSPKVTISSFSPLANLLKVTISSVLLLAQSPKVYNQFCLIIGSFSQGLLLALSNYQLILSRFTISSVLPLSHFSQGLSHYWLILPRFTISSFLPLAHSAKVYHQLYLTTGSFSQSLSMALLTMGSSSRGLPFICLAVGSFFQGLPLPLSYFWLILQSLPFDWLILSRFVIRSVLLVAHSAKVSNSFVLSYFSLFLQVYHLICLTIVSFFQGLPLAGPNKALLTTGCPKGTVDIQPLSGRDPN